MLIAAGILRTVHKHSSVTTLRGGGGTEKDFEIYVGNCPIIFGQDCMCVYGDPAYPLRIHLQAPYRQGRLTQQMEDYNKAMSEV